MKHGRAGSFLLLTFATLSLYAWTSPNITSLEPRFGSPSGGELVTISGTSWPQAPVRVFFDRKEAFVVSKTSTQIVVVTPPTDVGPSQALDLPVAVIFASGTADEMRVTAPYGFHVQHDVLQPSIIAVTPQSGALTAYTRVTIFGTAFQAPVQVFFGEQPGQVISITFDQIIVMAPPAAQAQQVPVRILNINSGTSATLDAGFLYRGVRRRSSPAR